MVLFVGQLDVVNCTCCFEKDYVVQRVDHWHILGMNCFFFSEKRGEGDRVKE